MTSDDILLNVADPGTSTRFYAGLLGRRPLEAGPEAYRMFHDEQNEVTKVVLKPGMAA